MLTSAFELGEELVKKRIEYKLHQPLWSKFDLNGINLEHSNWTTIKFLNNDSTDFSDQIGELPNDSGGLYLFCIRCQVIPGITNYPVYVGRAQLSEGQNLRKRCREYFTKWARNNERPLITKMINYWGNELYLSFMEVEENEDIIDFENKLIKSLLLPFNNDIPDKEIRQSVKAFP
ncbi:hypothetical protein J4E06_06165 [Muricauda sp. NFXS6]|uniref:hypothetical protein n=1 Tax=Allomuricauda sp. NFXS6 TaxID=2819094 RepID=UPI0032DF1054